MSNYASVYDAAQVRLDQFAAEYQRLKSEVLPYMRPVRQAIDLRLGLERAAKLPAGADQDTVLGYLIETYGLLAVGADPFLRAQLPLVPTQGATIRRRVLAGNGKAMLLSRKLVPTGARLVPNPPPTI
jgi:hypothetical protein